MKANLVGPTKIQALATLCLMTTIPSPGHGGEPDDILTKEFWKHEAEIIRTIDIEAKKCRIMSLADLSEIYSAKTVYRFTRLGGWGCMSIAAVESPEKQKALLIVTQEKWDPEAEKTFLTIREHSLKLGQFLDFVSALQKSEILTIPDIAPSEQSYDGGFDDLPTGFFESLVNGEYKRRVRIQMNEEVVEIQFFKVDELFLNLWLAARGIKPLPRGSAGPFK